MRSNRVGPSVSAGRKEPGTMPVVPSRRAWDAVLEGDARRALERDALPSFLPRQRWFAGKARALKSVRFLDRTSGTGLPESTRLTLIEVASDAGHPDTYLLPIGLAT